MSILRKLLINNTLKSKSIPLRATAVQAGSAIKLTGTAFDNVDIKYKLKNSSSWKNYTKDQIIFLQNENDYVQFKNNTSTFSTSNSSYNYFQMSGLIKCTGNTNSLINYKDISEGCFLYLFNNCSSLTKAPQLPATKLAGGCYDGMFARCTSLSAAPQLPATNLVNNCYLQMFLGCSSLIQAPQLPATNLSSNCYMSMFRHCTSLIQAPQLPATNLADSCYYQMFSNCISLSAAPQLPATNLAQYCYCQMFRNCSSLIEAPSQLPATNLSTSCYNNMFSNCTSLSAAPQLPAINLAQYCYAGMFTDCKSLIKAPQLPATNLAQYCYAGMFTDCKSLSSINVKFIDWNASIKATYNWVQNVASYGEFRKPADLEEIYGNSNIPNGWKVIVTDRLMTYYEPIKTGVFHTKNAGTEDEPIITITSSYYTPESKTILLS